MPLSAGSRLDHYEIVEPLGAGAMGQVYRARDTSLDRDVAIKVLPEHLQKDTEARGRFEREAKSVAALSHPNIMAIHGIGEADDTAYAVSELLRGEDLAHRLASGPVPRRKAIDYACQIAEGLAAAHESGVVHRDIKPANLFVTQDGRVKILDFGLARSAVSRSDETQDLSPNITEPGAVVGSPAYMSPEQVQGIETDHRSDIFSFGLVLYELLAGRQAFSAPSSVEAMNAILKDDPAALSTTDSTVPPALERIVLRCLEKQPAERFQSARDLAFALASTDTKSSSSDTRAPTPATPRQKSRLLPALLLIVFGGVLGGILQSSVPDVENEPVRTRTITYSGRDRAPSASPDGKMIAFVSERGEGQRRIWLRQMNTGTEVPLTDGPDDLPTFSPDGSSVLFIRDEGGSFAAYRTPIVGGKPRKIIEGAIEATWSPDGARIGFLKSSNEDRSGDTLFLKELRSGEERALYSIPFPRRLFGITWSPDGRHIAATDSGQVMSTAESRMLLIDAETGELVKSTPHKGSRISNPAWNGNESLIYAVSPSLIGDYSTADGKVVEHDLATDELRTLFWAHGVGSAGNSAEFEVLRRGTVVFDEYLSRQNLVEIDDFAGDAPGPSRHHTRGLARDRQPAYSSDGDMVIFSSNRSGNLDIWTLNAVTGDVHQLTDDAADDWDPAFTPDGKGFIWSSARGGHLEIWMANLDGSGAHQVSRDGHDAENPTLTKSGWVIYASGHVEKTGVWKVRADGGESIQLTEGAHLLPEVSPDEKYVLYAFSDFASNRRVLEVTELESGKVVFSTEALGGGLRYVISLGRPRWMPDGKSFLFNGADEEGTTGIFWQKFTVGEDTTATRRKVAGFSREYDVESFGVSPDGNRLMLSVMEDLRSIKIAEGVPGVGEGR